MASHFLSNDGRPLNPSDPESVEKFAEMLLIVELSARVVADQQTDYCRQVDDELMGRNAATHAGVAAGGVRPEAECPSARWTTFESRRGGRGDCAASIVGSGDP